MAGLKRFQYVDKDHAAIVANVIARLKERYGEDAWNDFEEDSSGVMLLEAFAYIVDLLLFYLDRQANEAYLPTATERQNLINLCKLIGYSPAGAQPAQADITVSINEPHATDVTLPEGAQIETQGGVIFETKEDAVIRAGESSVVVGAAEGETFEELVGVSDGERNQEFYFPRSGVIEVIELTVADLTWDAVNSLVDQTSDSRSYMAELDAWGRVRISFGDGVNGQVPRSGSRIMARYRIGGGVRGNVAPNTLTNVRDIAADEDGNRVPVSVTNKAWASGGSEPKSAGSIKLWAPRFFETQNRCVTQQDYETFAKTYNAPDVGAIAKARAVCRERSGEANVIRCYILTYDSTAGTVSLAPQTLKTSLLAYLNQYKMMTDWVEIEDGKWRAVNFSGTLTVTSGVKADTVLSTVRKVLESLLNIETREMGESLRISDVYAAIDNVEGVLHVELTEPVATVEAEPSELLIIGDIALKVKYEGAGADGKNL